jgi:cytochrome c oxidase cbb3-type subunit 3
MNAKRLSSVLLVALVLMVSCEREERDFHVDPAAANTFHPLRLTQLQPGTTRPVPPPNATTAPTTALAPTTSSSDVIPRSAEATQSSVIPLGSSPPPATGESRLSVAIAPGVDAMAYADPAGKLTPAPRDYSRNAFALSEGKRLYTYMNCVGCHAHGGGGMGPALMDSLWLYGSSPEEVFTTIVQGRPNGMPAFGGRLPDYQLWQIAHYVRSMSGLVSRDAAPGREDRLKNKPSENTIEPSQPRSVK